MKTINESFEDEEFKDLIEKKKDYSWHDFILLLTTWDEDQENKKEVD